MPVERPPVEIQPRSGDAGGPFGQADLWIGAGPPARGLQRPLGPGDIPGPLWTMDRFGPPVKFSSGQMWARIFDYCWELQEDDTVTGGDYHSIEYVFGHRPDRKYHPHCPDNSNRDKRFVADFRSPWGYHSRSFPAREQAQAWLDERWMQVEAVARSARGLPPNAHERGFESLHGHSLYGIEFPPYYAPIDEVRVLPDTVAISDGVLRGLVRNWSRHLWAYEVTITVDGHEFVWPLSIQPGEAAPFEIAGWVGSADPAEAQIAVAANMSWHTDPSRASGRYTGWIKLFKHPDSPRVLEDSLRDRYPQVTPDVASGSRTSLIMDTEWQLLTVPSSHLSIADAVGDLTVADLRAYVAVYDSHGRIFDVGPAEILGWTWDSNLGSRNLVRVDAWPHPAVDLDDRSVLLWFAVHQAPVTVPGEQPGPYTTEATVIDGDESTMSYEPFDGGFVLWVGAAFPSRPVS